MPDSTPKQSAASTESRGDNRRSFFTVAAALATGAVALLTPLAIGVASFLSPLFRRRDNARVRVALLDQTPDDGRPRFFPVVADRRDAWNRYPQQRIGGVYLIRPTGAEAPVALTAKCPHAGCFIGYSPGDEQFKCPCHTSRFHFDGSRVNGDAEVSPRDMDALPVELKQVTTVDGDQLTEVWIEYIDFQTGHKEAIPTA
jgi:Rieske Fe-S protein